MKQRLGCSLAPALVQAGNACSALMAFAGEVTIRTSSILLLQDPARVLAASMSA
jgi:hypothetical protein